MPVKSVMMLDASILFFRDIASIQGFGGMF
jgi:hypothetical protein